MSLFPTQIVGSYCKPHWLCDHEQIYTQEGHWWKIPAADLPGALDDASRIAIDEQNRAGLTYCTDGEQRRQTFSGYFYRLGGIDSDHRAALTFRTNDIGSAITMKARQAPVVAPPPPTQPRVISPIRWTSPILKHDFAYLKRYATGKTKMTVIGPCSLALRLADEHYGSLSKLAFALADALNQEIRALEAAGADLIQIDEPEVHFRYSELRDFAQEAIDRALHGVKAQTAVHVCFGYSKNIAEKRESPVYIQAIQLLASTRVDAISLEYEQPGYGPDLLTHLGTKAAILGLLNLDTEAPVETVDHISRRAREALQVLPASRLSLAPDCGMWFLPRETAFGKIENLEKAAQLLRSDHHH